jgi:Spy/CpxP family protein refolding chaperone
MLMLGSNGAWAVENLDEQTPPPPVENEALADKTHNLKMRAEKFANELGLSEEQRKKAEEIRKADFEKMKPLMEEMKALREKMDAMRKENMKSFEAILTPEQQVKFKEMIDEHKRKMEERSFHRFGRHHGSERPLAPEVETK